MLKNLTSLQTQSKMDKTHPFNIYFDLDVTNINDLSEAVPLVFKDGRNNFFLNCPSNYYMSVIRFNLETGYNFPVFIPKIQTGQADINLTVYKIKIAYWTGAVYNYFDVVINYLPEDQTINPATIIPPLDKQDVSGSYYYIYSYLWFINLINKAIDDAIVLNGLIFDFHPYFMIDTSTFNVKFVYPSTFIGTNKHMFYFNNELNALFPTMPTSKINVSTFGAFHEILTPQNLQLPFSSLAGINYYTTTTENTPFPAWNPVSEIVFLTSLLPVVSTNVGVPRIFNSNGSGLQNPGNNSNVYTILTDFVVGIGPNNSYKPYVLYNPTAQYRLNDLYGDSPLNNIDLSIFWKDKFGNLYPFLLQSGNTASVKILFQRKDMWTQ